MNQQLQTILDIIQQNDKLSAEEKTELVKAVKKADSDLTISEFKLERTEKVKRTTAILLEETITELEQKRKAVEAQNRELEIEATLERVRAIALSMNEPADMLEVCKTISHQLQLLGVKEIRNVQTAIFYESRGTYMNYEFYAKHDKLLITDVDYKNNKLQFSFADQMLNGKGELYTESLKGKQLNEWYAYQKTTNQFIDTFLEHANSLNYYWYSLGPVALGISTYFPLDEKDLNLFNRFRNVFEMAYRRFIDIEKAEAQAREAKIEAALERVRSRSLAMHQSDELQQLVVVVFDRLRELDITMDAANIDIFSEGSRDADLWIASPGQNYATCFHLPYTENPVPSEIFNAREKGDDLFKKTFPYEVKNSYFRYLFEHSDFKHLPDIRKNKMLEGAAYAVSFAFTKNAAISIHNYSGKRFSDSDNEILKRFAKVFEQAYIRFLDLQKAEAQVRDAQIEASLERVRSKTMAMHNSEDVGDTVATMFAEFVNLGIYTNRCGILIFNNKDSAEVWTARSNHEGKATLITGRLDLNSHKLLSSAYEAWKAKRSFYQYDLLDDDLKRYYEAINKSEYYQIKFDINSLPSKEYHRDFFFPEGGVFTFNGEPIIEEHSKIFKRFAGVFGQTYRRYLDLQKAEAQAREARIEAALEKVRSSSLAMHKSDELKQVVKIVFKELQQLNFAIDGAAFICTPVENSKDFDIWIGDNHAEYPTCFRTPFYDTPSQVDIFKAIESGTDFFSGTYSFEEKNQWFKYAFEHTDYKALPDELKNWILQQKYLTQSIALAKKSGVGLHFHQQRTLSENEIDILKRFSKVFDQGYIRFLDLQKAEAQAREAQIELGLERVRARAMAMRNSDELKELIGMVFTELTKLDLALTRCIIWVFEPATKAARWWMANSEEPSNPMSFYIKYHEHPAYLTFVNEWEKQNVRFVYDLKDQDKIAWDNILFNETELQHLPAVVKNGMKAPVRVLLSASFNNFGGINVASLEPLSEEHFDILLRFAKVFDLTYTRFNDLKQAEAQAKEAIKASSLDRIRAEIASMRTAYDLQRITPLVWRELKTLGVPFFRCGVFIINEKEKKVHLYLSTPDNLPLAALHLDFHSSVTTGNAIEHWREQKVYKEHWDSEQFVAWVQSLVGQGQIKGTETYQGGEQPPESLTLQFVPFKQGMLYVGSDDPLSESQIELVQAVADAFSVAYARYEDFTNLEAAKEQVDNTLKELRSTQSQLIQSEKMASLGELTAGIAHEIQNPLNFVNNFSELNKELLIEMKEEMDKGNVDEVKAIAKDIIDNEEKINHHGKRADAIVKSMLQHSRSSSGKKEPTDINVLADEYLRLAYHGLRAKDKSFNVTTKTDFDQSIGKINVLQQDIGRVILNLITNAFYVVSEKKKNSPPSPKGEKENYEPTVTVTTKRINSPSGDRGVMISVADNGTGIPQKVLDKIFQPFFTTKPTGQGTGLGLSLSYDIVKAHGGELTVETKEGEGTIFSIILSI